MNLEVSGYRIVRDPAAMDVDVIHAYLQRSYWAAERSREIVEKSLRHSDCYGVFEGAVQVGFARVVSDHATFAYLSDVFILESHQGRGLSKWLMQEVVGSPEYATLRRWTLRTRDAHGLYAQFGFVTTPMPEMEMEFRPGGH
jgi:GNAT superfamily N-acetyltransferase